MAKRFQDQVAWITGGGSGIGRELALAFADEGATVALSGRRQERLELVAAEIEGNGGKAFIVPCDVTDEASVEGAVQQVVETLGRLDVAVANAGVSVVGEIAKLSAADWRRQLDVNVVGLAITARYAIPHLERHAGRLVLIGSAAGMIAVPEMGAYCASKYAVRAIGQTLAVELHGTGVTCTTICPGFIETDLEVVNQGPFDPTHGSTAVRKLLWPTDRATKLMINAVADRKREYAITAHGKLGIFVGSHLPGLAHFVLSRGKRHLR